MDSAGSLPRLTADHFASFERDGFLHLPCQDHGLVPDPAALMRWTDEIYQWPLEKGKWMPYNEVNPEGKQLVMRTEKIVDYHPGAQSLLCGDGMLAMLKQLTGKDMLLFKDKVNYKHPGANGFVAHIDAPAYEHMGEMKFMEIMVVVDPQRPENGCLEFVPGSHKMDVKLANGGRLDQQWEDTHEFTKLTLNPGDIVIFGSRIAHRSGRNPTAHRRAAFFGTYHFEVDQPDMRERYFSHRREVFPPDHGRFLPSLMPKAILPEFQANTARPEREQGQEYKAGWKMFAYSSPFVQPAKATATAM